MTAKLQKMKATHAKNRFGELLDIAQAGPVMIEKNGRDVAVLLSKAEYQRLLMGAGASSQQIEPVVSPIIVEAAPEVKQRPPKKKKTKKKKAKQQPADEEVEIILPTATEAEPTAVETEDEEPVAEEADEVDVHALVHISIERHNQQWAGVYQALAGEQQ